MESNSSVNYISNEEFQSLLSKFGEKLGKFFMDYKSLNNIMFNNIEKDKFLNNLKGFVKKFIYESEYSFVLAIGDNFEFLYDYLKACLTSTNSHNETQDVLFKIVLNEFVKNSIFIIQNGPLEFNKQKQQRNIATVIN